MRIWSAQLAVVGHVAVGHEKVVAADPRDAVFLFAGAIDGHAFANDVLPSPISTRVSLPW